MNNDTNKNSAAAAQNILIELAFKPLVPNLKLRPQESQLLLAYIGEILREIEEEEKTIKEQESPCK
ncbi:MAG: hypothetical protein PHS57_09955 [Alphaproteobacteria bacterium]|nr:hypothetical protein [Alphaproteobacteria bacterium]